MVIDGDLNKSNYREEVGKERSLIRMKSDRTCTKEEIQMVKKTHEKMLTIPGHKGNANQNHVKIPPHSC
jgi:hypothetical protein